MGFVFGLLNSVDTICRIDVVDFIWEIWNFTKGGDSIMSLSGIDRGLSMTWNIDPGNLRITWRSDKKVGPGDFMVSFYHPLVN